MGKGENAMRHTQATGPILLVVVAGFVVFWGGHRTADQVASENEPQTSKAEMCNAHCTANTMVAEDAPSVSDWETLATLAGKIEIYDKRGIDDYPNYGSEAYMAVGDRAKSLTQKSIPDHRTLEDFLEAYQRTAGFSYTNYPLLKIAEGAKGKTGTKDLKAVLLEHYSETAGFQNKKNETIEAINAL
jgi:hypothetical protein